MPSDQFHRVEKLTGECEQWREVGTSGNPDFENSWTNYGSGYEVAAFMKDKFNFVHFKGFVKNGTVNTNIFTLPEGYRPSEIAVFTCTESNTGAVRLTIDTLGQIKTAGATANGAQDIGGVFRV